MVSAITHGPVAGILPALYSAEFGLDLAVIGTVLLIARLFDAVTDPLIGLLSDQTNSRFGRRKPWILLGSLIITVAVYLLFRPGQDAGVVYFLALSLLIYLGWTLAEIPYASWILELSNDTQERARINGARSLALFAGGFAFTIAPQFVPEAQGQMNFQVLGVLAIVLAIAIPVTSCLAVWRVPQGRVPVPSKTPKLSELWSSLKGNKPFQFFLLAYLFIGLASGVGNVLVFMYVDSYLGLGHRYTELFLPAMIVGPLMIPVWLWVIRRFGKYRTTAWAFIGNALLMPLPWFIQPGESAFVPMLIFYSFTAMFAPLLMITMPTILGDVVDYDELNTGKNRAGQYNAFLALITKAMAAIGGPIALILVGLYGYQPGIENTAEATNGLRIVFNLLPPLIIVPGIILLWRFPITDASQIVMSDALRSRERTDSPLVGEH